MKGTIRFILAIALAVLASWGSLYLAEHSGSYQAAVRLRPVGTAQPQTCGQKAGEDDPARRREPVEAFGDQSKLAAYPDVAQVVAYLSGLDPESRQQGLKDLEQWGAQHEIYLHAIEAENGRYFRSGLPEMLLVDVSSNKDYQYLYDAHLICWWTLEPGEPHWIEHFHYQVFYSADRAENDLDRNFNITSARLAPDDQGRTEMGAVYETCSGTGAPIPAYYLMRLGTDGWQILWHTSEPGDQWRAFHGVVAFTGPGLEGFNISGDIWNYEGQDEIFSESNAGPHRWFSDTWERQGDSYRRVRATIIPSAYNTLINFMRHLKEGQTSQAVQLVADRNLITKAREAGMVQPLHPRGQDWVIAYNNDVHLLTGPITFITGPASGTAISFKKTGGDWVIISIKK